jgi:Methyltransferase domain
VVRWDLVNQWVRERNYKVGLGVGVHLGVMFRHILRMCPKDFIWYGVDLFEPRPGLDEVGGESYSREDLPGSLRRLVADLALPDPTFVAKGALIKGESTEIAKTFADCSLDIVFIDGDHREEAVLADIAAWLPKIRYGGTISGHDCEVIPQHPHCAGVIRAVSAAFAGWNAHPDNVWEVPL